MSMMQRRLTLVITPSQNINISGHDFVTKSRIRKYTLSIFLERAQKIHGNKFDYSHIKAEDIKGSISEVEVICRTCGYIWHPSITGHIISKSGCPSCAGLAPLTFETFLVRAHGLYGDQHEYPGLSPDKVKGSRTLISVRCKICLHTWETSIATHIYRKYECRGCTNVVPPNKRLFIMKAREIHGDKFDYSAIPDELINNKSKGLIRCLICDHTWSQNLESHIRGHGCPACYGNARLTLTTFLIQPQQVHGDRYDYSQVREDHIRGTHSKIPISCNKCKYNWFIEIASHLHAKNGCPKCRFSKGELECCSRLDSIGINYECQYELPDFRGYHFDFMFEVNTRKYLLEFDGGQHFAFTPFFHKSEERFKRKQNIDITKTQKGIEAGYFVIRIDHTHINNIGWHIQQAIASPPGRQYYVSDNVQYHFLVSAMNTYFIRQLVNR